ncbi:MAG: hypothetical protein RL754_1269 [Bacteroidota bacterium]|jgi:hypothetical protein
MGKISPLYALQAAWVRYKNKGGMYTVFFIVGLFVSFAASSFALAIGGALTFLNTTLGSMVAALLVGVVSTFITLGYAHFARQDEQGLQPVFNNFFDGFKSHTKTVIAVALVVTLVSQFIQLGLTSDVPVFEMGEETGDFEEMLMALEDYSETIMPYVPQILISVVLLMLFSLFVMFAPYHSSFTGEGLAYSLKWSAKSVLGNLLPILFTYLAAIIIGTFLVVLTFGLAVLVFAPYLNLLQYELYDQLSPKHSRQI